MADPVYLTQYVILIPGRCKILCIRLRVGMDQTRKLYCNSMFCNHESQTKPILSVLGFLFYGIVFQISTCQIKWVGVGSFIFFIITQRLLNCYVNMRNQCWHLTTARGHQNVIHLNFNFLQIQQFSLYTTMPFRYKTLGK